MFLNTLLFAIQTTFPLELDVYLSRPEPAYSWKLLEQETRLDHLSLTSQTWQGIDWKHDLYIAYPRKAVAKETSILYITGGKPNTTDLLMVRLIAEEAGLPVAVLFQIPNQPIFDRTEDDLIAHTFEKYLETGDATWPLLFPMTKSALQAMDAIEAHTKGTDNVLKKFVITGASKRGWTTWLTAATGDKRVAGIAPAVIDNLNIPVQMKHQIELWGEYSPAIEDYTKRGLQGELRNQRGQKLATMVDPYSYRSKITAPTLIINGANDPYWTVDALNNYWSDLTQPKWVVIVPNAGHDLADRKWALKALAIFSRSRAGAVELPRPTWKWSKDNFQLNYKSLGNGLRSVRLWSASSKDFKFNESKWGVLSSHEPASRFENDKIEFLVEKVNKEHINKNCVYIVEFEYELGGIRFSLTSQPALYKKGKLVSPKP